MENEPFSLLLLLLGCIIGEAFFTMQEIACVSFNKVRLQYYVANNSKRAIWLSSLLSTPSRLFGTTLLTASLCLQLGSETSRRLYESLGFSPDFAPLSQVILVVIFAEMAPMFAARKHPEHVAMAGSPILFVLSILFLPVIKILDLICKGVNALLGIKSETNAILSREELLKILEEREEGGSSSDLNTVVSSIFSLKHRLASEIMLPLTTVQMVPSNSTHEELRNILRVQYSPFVPVYQRNYQNIIGVVYPRDLIKAEGKGWIKNYMRSAWFITENQSISDILRQFRRNNQSVAIVLNKLGLASGIITLDTIIDTMFDRTDDWISVGDLIPRGRQVVVEKVFSADMLIDEFNATFNTNLFDASSKTLLDIFINHLGHIPTKGELIRLGQFELIVEECTLRGPKTILVKTISS